MKKKLFKFFAVTAAAAMIFTGCGASQNAKEETKPEETKLEETKAEETKESKAETEAEGVKMEADDDIHILYFNDFHGNIAEEVTGKKRNMGMAKMVGYVNEFKSAHPNTIVLSGGDNYQGTCDSNLTVGKPVTAMMKGMGVTASAVGNHEFDWGFDKIADWSKEGDFTYLAANICEDGKPVSWAQPYKIYDIDGKKIAFIGLAHPDTPTLTKAANTKGLTFEDPIAVANEWVKFLNDGKAEEGKPDMIALLTHIDSDQDRDSKEVSGYAVELAEKVEGISLILSAHSHRTVNGIVNNVPIIQASKYGRAIGDVDIKFVDGKPEITAELFMGKDIKDDIIEDNAAAEVRDDLAAELEPIKGEVLGQATADLSHDRKSKGSNTELGYWACKVMADKTGADVAIQNGGGLRRSLLKGDITMGDMYEIMPFDNYLVVMDLPGKDLIKAIDHGINMEDTTDGDFSGLKVEYDGTKPQGEQIVKITLSDGTEIDPEKMYKVVVNDFMFTGGDGYDFSAAENVDETYVPVRDVLVEAVKEQKEVSPEKIDYIENISENAETVEAVEAETDKAA